LKSLRARIGQPKGSSALPHAFGLSNKWEETPSKEGNPRLIPGFQHHARVSAVFLVNLAASVAMKENHSVAGC